MSRVSDLLARVAESNPELAKALEAEVNTLASRREFGLNFERHIPEEIRLPGRVAHRGDKVVFVAPRENPDEEVDGRTWLVIRITKKAKRSVADLVELSSLDEQPATAERAVDDLAVIAEFRDPIYPGLRSTGKVERAGEKPWHTVINGENYHVLEMLGFAYEGAVDCIYIDPPYNTRDKDWKYNNDYVDSDDAYRHSKWLAMMERRLKLAKRLLNPMNSVLIVTIDEKEYLRLGLLLEQVFPASDIQMITTVINPKGSARSGRFSRVDEYVFFVMVGASRVRPWTSDMLRPVTAATRQVRWAGLMRQGEGSRRERIPSMYFPIYIDAESGEFHSAGEPPPLGVTPSEVEGPARTVVLWPVDKSGRDMMWRLNPASVREYVTEGYLKFGRRDPETGVRPVLYLQQGILDAIESGEVEVVGRDSEGAVVLEFADRLGTRKPTTTWNMTSHSASEHGSTILKAFIPGRRFPYPKSLYAVEDALRFFVADKPDAVILDFFAGSGTTTHAVMRLNRQDGGQRQSICVTNNEVSDAEARDLSAKGHRAGDPEWEALGICEHITKPRITAAVTGETPDGRPVAGNYKFTDEFPYAAGLDENVEFFDLTYEDPERVRHDLAFKAIDPMLWLRAGAQGSRLVQHGVGRALANRYGVLFDVDAAAEFVEDVRKADGLRVAYIVTDDEKQFQIVAGQLPERVETVRLYEAYLRTFRINLGEE